MTKRRTRGLSSFEKETAARARKARAIKKPNEAEAEPALNKPTNNPYLKILVALDIANGRIDNANVGKEVDKHGTDAR